ncbi:hypothetical protein LZY01_10630 [Levilactobacillus zymae]|uniref:Type I restriction modification DNA specificity domain-containing protein n=2 Tax=Levilactobacillus zymae TaxID=267363 RepID=A0ABQ0WVK4_9LACO|nr:restriction endonuclease subunit S [Levilactobacillus zymae]GEO71895.1 hypothetical protein LZY01_10630 [Levilactobacillus zymae]
MLSVTINDGVVKASSLKRKDNSSSDKSNYKLVRKGDIAYNSMRMWQGASGTSPYSGIVSPAYTIITPINNIVVDFFAYQFKMKSSLYKFQKYSQGLTSDTWNLKFPLLREIKMIAPNKNEQIKIVCLLKKLDSTIASNQRHPFLLKIRPRPPP